MLASYRLICRLCGQCRIPKAISNCVLCDCVFLLFSSKQGTYYNKTTIRLSFCHIRNNRILVTAICLRLQCRITQKPHPKFVQYCTKGSWTFYPFFDTRERLKKKRVFKFIRIIVDQLYFTRIARPPFAQFFLHNKI